MLKKYMHTLLKVLIPVVLAIALISLSLRAIGLFWPFVVAYIVALSVSPLVDWFEAKIKIKPKYMSLLLVAIILALIVLFIMYVFSVIANNIPKLEALFFEALNIIKTYNLPFDLNLESLVESVKNNISTIAEYISGITQNATNIISAIPDIIFKFIIMILAAYFLIADRKRIGRFVYSKVDEATKEKIETVITESKVLVNAYIISQIKIMLCVAAILAVGFTILGFKATLIIPLVAVLAFFDFLPVLGSGTVLIPWFLYCFVSGNIGQGIGLLMLYLAVTVFRQAASPKIVGEQVGLGAFPSLLLMYAGYIFYSWAGLIVAVPLAVLILNLYKKHFFDSFINNLKKLLDNTKDIFQN